MTNHRTPEQHLGRFSITQNGYVVRHLPGGFVVALVRAETVIHEIKNRNPKRSQDTWVDEVYAQTDAGQVARLTPLYQLAAE